MPKISWIGVFVLVIAVVMIAVTGVKRNDNVSTVGSGEAAEDIRDNDELTADATAAAPTPAPPMSSTSDGLSNSSVVERVPAPSPVTTVPLNEVSQIRNTLANEAVVSYFGSGFTPLSITVRAGTTIKFENESGNNFWVASDPHPVHTAFPALDAKHAYGPGETFSFTFVKPGTYSYHNHLRANERGIINVTE